MKITKAILPAAAIVLAAGLAACGSTAVHLTTPASTPSATATSPAPVKTVTASPSSPQVNININNNPAPAPARTVYVAPPNEAQPDSWSVFAAYVSDVNDGDAQAVWNMLGPAEQASWNNNYGTLAAWVAQTTITGLSEVSESGDTVTVMFDLSNSAGSDVPYIDTATVANGIINSDNSALD